MPEASSAFSFKLSPLRSRPVPPCGCFFYLIAMSEFSLYSVREATVRDAKAVAHVHQASLQAAFEPWAEPAVIPQVPLEKRTAFWKDAIEFLEPQVQVACMGDEVVGFVGYDRSRDPKTPNTMGEIWAIYVLPEHWNGGAGLALWDAAREALIDEGCTHVTAWLPLGCERTLRFFDEAGFKREMNTARTTPSGKGKIEEMRVKRAIA